MTQMLRKALAILLAVLVSPALHAPIVWAAEEGGAAEPTQPALVEYHAFTPEELRARWEEFSKDPGWKELVKSAKAPGWARKVDEDTAMWGFEGRTAEGEPVLVALYDFQHPSQKKGSLTLLWSQRGDQVYKAYMKFPTDMRAGKEELSFDTVVAALEEGEEWYFDPAEKKVKKANSWFSCFRTQVYRHCPGWCGGMIAACAGAVLTISIASGGIGLAAAIGLFAGCAGILCGACMGVAAIGCIGS